MSDFIFGVERRRVSAREVARRNRVCRAEGGYGYCQVDESHGTASGGRWRGWFRGPNRGEPFDRDLARRVLGRLGLAGPYRAFQGPNGWYVAFEDAEGFHRQPPGGGDLYEEEARREAQRRNAGAYREGVR